MEMVLRPSLAGLVTDHRRQRSVKRRKEGNAFIRIIAGKKAGVSVSPVGVMATVVKL
jgi:hypothetical protein